MKKFFIASVMLAVFAVVVPIAANAQTCRPKRKSFASSNYATRNYASNSYQTQRPGFWSRHRNTRNILLSTGGGALIGGLWGGNRRSIGKGALVGAGAGALYTFILKPKRRGY